ncbi:MAG: prephenate dehydrogenase [Planctomycetota bacterium]
MRNDSDAWPRKIGILGVGLLGGSTALAIRRARPDTRVVGLTRNEQNAQQLLDLGVIDQTSPSVESVCESCDVVVVATPVDLIADLVVQAAEFTEPDCLITDVGSTKAQIVNALSKQPKAESKFVAAHPIAGSEKTGASHATATLMEGKVIVLTPGPRTPDPVLQQAIQFWEMTGGVIQQMSAEQHDTHLASVSHVPHLVSALVALLPHPKARPLVGSGWQDITRVAAGDPGMWTAICQENREAILDELDRFAAELVRIREMLDDQQMEALHAWLTKAKQLKQQSI